MINIKDVINNVTMLSQTLPSLNIDSIFIEQDGKIEKYFYKNEQITSSILFPNQLKASINTIGGQYDYRKGKWKGSVVLSNSISTQSLRNFDAQLNYNLNDKNNLTFHFQKHFLLKNF